MSNDEYDWDNLSPEIRDLILMWEEMRRRIRTQKEAWIEDKRGLSPRYDRKKGTFTERMYFHRTGEESGQHIPVYRTRQGELFAYNPESRYRFAVKEDDDFLTVDEWLTWGSW